MTVFWKSRPRSRPKEQKNEDNEIRENRTVGSSTKNKMESSSSSSSSSGFGSIDHKILLLMDRQELESFFWDHADCGKLMDEAALLKALVNEFGLTSTANRKLVETLLGTTTYPTTTTTTGTAGTNHQGRAMVDRDSFRSVLTEERLDDANNYDAIWESTNDKLDECFDRYANRGQYMSRDAFRKALCDLELAEEDHEHAENEEQKETDEYGSGPQQARRQSWIDELMDCHDYDGDGMLNQQEFMATLRVKGELEKLLVGLPILRALAKNLKRQFQQGSKRKSIVNGVRDGDDSMQESFAFMTDDSIRKAVEASVETTVAILSKSASEMRQQPRFQKATKEEGLPDLEEKTEQVQHTAGEKYQFHITGGTLEDYNEGLTRRVGAPDLHVERGMRREHVEADGANVIFTSANYKVRTTPKIEFQLAISAGQYYKNIAKRGNDQEIDELSDEEQALVREYDGEPHRGNGPKRHFVSISESLELPIAKIADLTRMEIIALILYTGPMYMKWNQTLRQGTNSYCTSVHVLSSAIKKVQQSGYMLRPGMVLYRGLSGGKLPSRIFSPDKNHKGQTGMTEFGIQSTTSDLRVALQYSGVSRGFASTVVETRVSQVDSGAFVSELSQYPTEQEFIYPPGCYMEAEGEGRMEFTSEGLVRIVPVRINTNGRVMSVEEMVGERRANVMKTFELVEREIEFELKRFEKDDKIVQILSEHCRSAFGNIFQSSDYLQYKHGGSGMRMLGPPWVVKRAKLRNRLYGELGEETPAVSLHNTGLVQLILRIFLPTWYKENIIDRETTWFNKDNNYKKLLEEVIALKRQAIGAIEFLKEGGEDWKVREDMESIVSTYWEWSLEKVDRKRMTFLRKRISKLREHREAGEKVNDDIQQVAIALCEREGLHVGTVDKETGETLLMKEAVKGNLATVQLLVEANEDVDAVDKLDGKTAVMMAAENNQLAVMECLIHLGGASISRRSHDDKSALYLACQDGHTRIVKFLVLTCGEDPNTICKDRYPTPLLVAVTNGHAAVVELLLKAGAVVDWSDGLNNGALGQATRVGNLNMVKLLVEKGKADIEFRGYASYTPIFEPAEHGYFEVVKYLATDCGADINAVAKSGTTCLMLAARNGHAAIVDFLLNQCGANPDLVDDKENIALLYAVQNEKSEVVKLLANKANANLALVKAVQCNSITMIDLLVNVIGADVNSLDPEGKSLLSAVAGSNLEIIKAMMERFGCDAKVLDEDGRSVLHIAALQTWNETEKIVAYLLKNDDIDPNLVDKAGKTALMLAEKDEVMELIARHASVEVNARDMDGKTCLMHAAQKGNPKGVRVLIDCGTDVDAVDSKGRNAVTIAIQNSEYFSEAKLETIKFLLEEFGSRPSLSAKEALNAFEIATRLASTDTRFLIQLLVKEFGVDVDTILDTGTQSTGLHLAAKLAREDIALCLLELGASLNARTIEGLTPLLTAATRFGGIITRPQKHQSLILSLLRKGSEVTERDSNGNTVLHHAIDLGLESTFLSVLIDDYCADTNATNKDGVTVLMKVCQVGDVELAKELVETRKVSVDKTDHKGWDALMHAVGSMELDQGHLDVARLLLQRYPKSGDCALLLRRNEHGQTALLLACLASRKEEDPLLLETLVKLMVEEYHADVNAHDSIEERSCLLWASAKGHLSIVRYLATHTNATLTAVDKAGNNVLHLACQARSQGRDAIRGIVKFLVEELHIDDVSTKNEEGKTALELIEHDSDLENIVRFEMERKGGSKAKV